MGIRVGIDLGTTYTKIAYVDALGTPVCINNMEGTDLTPSVVFFESLEKVIVGEEAKELSYLEPEKAINGIKKLLGKSNFAINIQGSDLEPEQVAALIIKKIIHDAAEVIGEEIDEVIIAVPATWGMNEVTALRNSVFITGIDRVSVVGETTAAALAYGVMSEKQEQTVLIYDLGGSSFQATVAFFNGTDIKIIGCECCSHIGGSNWNEVVERHLMDEFFNETGFDGDFDVYALQDITLKSEKAKRMLSCREEVPVLIDADGLRTRIKLSRSFFEKETEYLLNETVKYTDAVIEHAEAEGYKIDKILLIGGSSRMPQVIEKLHNKYNIKPELFEPELAIAKGAALYGEIMSFDNIKDVSTKSYAIKVVAEGKEFCQNMIIKNWQFRKGQIKVTKQFCIANNDLGKLDLAIYESEHTEEIYPVDEDLIFATVSFNSFEAGVPAIIQIEITLTVDKVLSVCCKNYHNGKTLAEVSFGINSKLRNDSTKSHIE